MMARRKVPAEQVQLGASLEMVISSHARDMAGRMLKIADWANSEEDVRYECNKLIDAFLEQAGLDIKGRHEYGLAGGRIDSKYAGVIIEYKLPSGPGKITEDPASAGNRAVSKQLRGRFADFKKHEPSSASRLFGVGTDGDTFVFVRERGESVEVEDPLPVTPYSVERLLRALVSLGANGKSFTAENLSSDFGSQSDPGTKGVRALYHALSGDLSPKADTLFAEWKVLFSEVCGYDVESPSEKIELLAEHYGLGKRASPARLLFALQSYYAVFMKFLAAELTASFSPMGDSVVRACANAATSDALRLQMLDLERGGIWSDLGITNFLEGDLFSWYVDCWDDGIADVIRAIAGSLDQYDSATLSVDPGESRDLLKHLYHELFPRSVRHGLGEYYTPDWLAEHTLDLVEYDGNPDKRVLDPACGSGTFLVVVINRIRRWYDAFGNSPPFGQKQLLERILKNVVGFDLNPLAVMAARTNVLLALRDLITEHDTVVLPIYLCDSIQPPSEHGALIADAELGRALSIPTAVGTLIVPTEVAQSRSVLEAYTELLNIAVSTGYDFEDFSQRCALLDIPFHDRDLHQQLFAQLTDLHAADKDGIWARIIKNAFAPNFVTAADYVVGNPPWIFWNNLPASYREQVRLVMTERYHIMSAGASSMKQLGAAGKDLSMLFVYVSMDKYLKRGGRLGFVITQSIFQTTAGNEFRHFELPSRSSIQVNAVEDWVQIEPFRPKAGNKSAILVATKGAKTTYPVKYTVWKSLDRFDRQSAELDEVLKKCARTVRWATPSNVHDRTSFWTITDSNSADSDPMPLASDPGYQARVGVETKLESAFRVVPLHSVPGDKLLVENDCSRARIALPQVTALLETDLLHPYLTGETVHRWHADPAGLYIVPHTEATGMTPIAESVMRVQYPLTYAYFSQFKEALKGRSLHLRWGKDNPFYAMYNIGPYTFAPFKVVWKRTTRNFAAAVVGSVEIRDVGERIYIPNGKVMMIPFDDEQAAHFLAAQINCSLARRRINDSITSEAHKGIINVLPLQRFEATNQLHQSISAASVLAHAASVGELSTLSEAERHVDTLVAELWGIDVREFDASRSSLPVAKVRDRTRRNRLQLSD